MFHVLWVTWFVRNRKLLNDTARVHYKKLTIIVEQDDAVNAIISRCIYVRIVKLHNELWFYWEILNDYYIVRSF